MEFYDKNVAVMRAIDQSTIHNSHDFSLLQNSADFENKHQENIFLGQKPDEQFFCCKPVVPNLTPLQKRTLKENFEDEIAGRSIDPLILALAGIHDSRMKKDIISENAAQHTYDKMINIMFGGAAPTQLIRSITRRLNKNLYSKMFKAFTELNNEDNIFKHFAQEIKDKRSLILLQKNANSSVVQYNNEDNQLFKYFQLCKENKTPVLPIFFKILNKKLTLNNYSLSEKQVEVLSQTFSQFPRLLE